jgi:hypothetical protein
MTSVDTLGRAFELYRRTMTSRSALVLLIANAIPLVGVVFFGWSLMTILVLYWLENGIVGVWNVPRILLAQGSLIPKLPDLPDSAALAATGDPARAAALQEQWRAAQAAQPSAAAAAPASGLPGARPLTVLGPRAAARLSSIPRIGLAIFFAFHYGMFWLVHGIFVFALPAFAGGFGSEPACLDVLPFPPGVSVPDGAAACAGASPFGTLVWGNVLLAGAALFISHGASFFLNYIGRGEYLTATAPGQMGAVYGRVVVLHLTIIFGSMFVAFLGAPIAALLVLVVLKSALDLGLHLRRHWTSGPLAAFQAPAAVAGP